MASGAQLRLPIEAARQDLETERPEIEARRRRLARQERSRGETGQRVHLEQHRSRLGVTRAGLGAGHDEVDAPVTLAPHRVPRRAGRGLNGAMRLFCS